MLQNKVTRTPALTAKVQIETATMAAIVCDRSERFPAIAETTALKQTS